MHIHRNPQHKEIIYIGWKRPPKGWIKLNSDGACKGNNETLGCGGLFCNTDGRGIKSYIKKNGLCDALHAKMGARVSRIGDGLERPHSTTYCGELFKALD